MNKSVLNVKTDPETKQQLQDFAAELGVQVSVIMNAQIKQMLRDRKIILSTELEPAEYLQTIMNEVEADITANKNITHTTSIAEALAHLDQL